MTNDEFLKNEDTFSYLMYLLFQNGKFSELHIPSLNYMAEKGNKILIKKIVPLEFEKRVNELLNLFNTSKLTNIKLNRKNKEGKNIILELSSKRGDLLKEKNLSDSEKKELIDLFFKYHDEINNPKIEFSNKYLDYFNETTTKKKIEEIREIINKKEKLNFDLIVLDYLDNFLMQNLPIVDYSKFKNKNVHGDFSQRNIVSTKKGLRVIDLEMAHKGYLELEFLKFLNNLFEFGSEEYMNFLKETIKEYSLNWKLTEEFFKLYLKHKMMDISVIKSAYFSNQEKYLALQNHIVERINFNKRLIQSYNKYCKQFNSLN